MKKEVFEIIKKEIKYIGLLFLLCLIIFKIAFYKEDFFVVFRTVLSLFWLFAIPGYFSMLYWHDKLEFMERFIAGIALAGAVIGVFSYYLGLLGLNTRYHAFLLPSAIILLGLTAAMTKKISAVHD